MAFNIQGVSELVHHGINGYTTPPKNVEKLADAILSLLEQPELAKTMGLKGRERLDDSWRIDTMIRRIAEEYTRLCRHAPDNSLSRTGNQLS